MATKAERERLPKRRSAYTYKVSIGGHAIHVTVGMYADGRPVELFIDMHKEGAAMRGMTHAFAIAVSLGLQYGVPIETFVNALKDVACDPSGDVLDFDGIKSAGSVPDLVVRMLAAISVHHKS